MNQYEECLRLDLKIEQLKSELTETKARLESAIQKLHDLNKELNVKVRSEQDQVSSEDLLRALTKHEDGK